VIVLDGNIVSACFQVAVVHLESHKSIVRPDADRHRPPFLVPAGGPHGVDHQVEPVREDRGGHIPFFAGLRRHGGGQVPPHRQHGQVDGQPAVVVGDHVEEAGIASSLHLEIARFGFDVHHVVREFRPVGGHPHHGQRGRRDLELLVGGRPEGVHRRGGYESGKEEGSLIHNLTGSSGSGRRRERRSPVGWNRRNRWNSPRRRRLTSCFLRRRPCRCLWESRC